MKEELFVSGIFERKHPSGSGSVYAMDIRKRNDLATRLDDVTTQPMLTMKHMKDAQGQDAVSHTMIYGVSTFNKIMDVANRDGDSLAFKASLLDVESYGSMVDEASITSTDQPFNLRKHVNHTRQKALAESDVSKTQEALQQKHADVSADGPDL